MTHVEETEKEEECQWMIDLLRQVGWEDKEDEEEGVYQ